VVALVVAVAKISVVVAMVVADAAAEDAKEGAMTVSFVNFVAKKGILS
jgi:hypothetical protein